MARRLPCAWPCDCVWPGALPAAAVGGDQLLVFRAHRYETNAGSAKAPGPAVGDNLAARLDLLTGAGQREAKGHFRAKLVRQTPSVLDRDATDGDILGLAQVEVSPIGLRNGERRGHATGTPPLLLGLTSLGRHLRAAAGRPGWRFFSSGTHTVDVRLLAKRRKKLTTPEVQMSDLHI